MFFNHVKQYLKVDTLSVSTKPSNFTNQSTEVDIFTFSSLIEL